MQSFTGFNNLLNTLLKKIPHVVRKPLHTALSTLQRKRQPVLILQNRIQLKPVVTPPVTTPKTYQYGQWIFPSSSTVTHAQITGYNTTNMKGFIKRFAWNSLEPGGGTPPVGGAAGTYDFSAITSDLAYCAAQTPPLYMVVLIEDKSFSGSTNMLPAYLDTETWVNGLGATITGYEFANGAGKATLRWKARVVERYNALTKAMAASFDNATGNNQYFLGIATQETAAGSSVTVATYDYTPEAYRDSYKQILQSASNSFARSYIHWIFNFFQGHQSYILDIAAYFSNAVNCPNLNVLAGGPDLKPWDGTLNGTGDAFTMYEPIRLMGTQMFCAFSSPCYDGSAIAGPRNNIPTPHQTVNVYSTIAASTALQISATAVVGGNLKITVPCTNAQSTLSVNPYAVGEYVNLDDGTLAGINVVVQSVGGTSGAYTATFTSNPAGAWVGKTASRYWTFAEYEAFASGTPTPDFPLHTVIHLRNIWWYPSGSAIYDYDNGTSPGGSDAKSWINAHATVWP